MGCHPQQMPNTLPVQNKLFAPTAHNTIQSGGQSTAKEEQLG